MVQRRKDDVATCEKPREAAHWHDGHGPDGSREVPVGNIGFGTAQQVAARHLSYEADQRVEEQLADDRDGQSAAARA